MREIKDVETRIVHRNFGEKPKYKLVKRNFSSGPSKDEITSDVSLIRSELKNNVNRFMKKIKHLLSKGDFDQIQYDVLKMEIESYQEKCSKLIDMFESSEFSSHLEYQKRKNDVINTILSLTDDLDKKILDEKLNTQVK